MADSPERRVQGERGSAGVEGDSEVTLAPQATDRDEQLAGFRDQVERTIARSRKLRQMAEHTGYTPEDVASEAFARYLAAQDKGIDNPAAWMVTAGRNFVYDLHRKGLQREAPSEPGSWILDQPRREEEPGIEENLDRRYEAKVYDAAVQRLDERDQRAIAAFEHAGSVRAVEREYGIPKSTVHRAFERLHGVLAMETGGATGRRARSRALAYHLGYMSPRQRAELESRLKWDTPLRMEVRGLRVGARQIAALVPPGAVAGAPTNRLSELVVRGRGLLDKVSDGALHLVGRGPESEAATGAIGLGGGAVTAKVAIGLCAGAASVGGVCVGTGVVPAPAIGGDRQAPAAAPTTPTDATPAVVADPSAERAAAGAAAAQPTSNEQQQQEFGGASAPSANGTTREFGPAPSSSSSSSGSGSGGGGGGGKESFGL